jgi:hypothetical protein
MKHLVLIIALMLAMAGNVSAKGYWPGPADPAPEPTPVPAPEPDPVQTIVIEYGARTVYPGEVNFHFTKPAAKYGRFNLNTAGRKYTIEGSYKDSNIEVRNSQTTKKLVVIAGSAYATKGAGVSYPSREPLTKPEVAPDPTPTPGGDIPLTTHYNHVNNYAFDGRGVAINMCQNEPNLKGATLNGVKMRLHGDRSGNCNREIWTNVDFIHKTPTKVDGEIVIERKDGTKGRIKITGSRPLWHQNKGDCFINCGD